MARLTSRWGKLRDHAVQAAYWLSPHRFNTAPAGRRSGKTELAKRRLVKRSMAGTRFSDPRFFAGAPTRDQAKRIFWEDLKRLVPDWMKRGRPSEGELVIPMINGASIWVVGLDKPERIEGQPWDGGVLDEFANMKPHTWGAHVRPALSDRAGWCDLIGVPEGRNHYYEVDKRAQAEMLERGAQSEWGRYHWVSADILPAEEIEAARRDLDDLTFQQEYEASFVNFRGRAYYPFLEASHCAKLAYDPKAPLVFCFDFNVDPGVAVVAQEQMLPRGGILGTGVIGEVWIPSNSNTPAVCRRLIKDWGKHEGRVTCYGDATGGARGSAQVQGSDWDLVKAELGAHFGDRVRYRVPEANPSERARINAMNSRLMAMDGTIRMMVDPSRAPHVVRDLEGVRLLEGGSGEIDKRRDPMLTHPTDGLGYYVVHEFPIVKPEAGTFSWRLY
jgi:hypothetical protein